MERLSIIGCGTMGHSIALAAAWAGIDVKVSGATEEDISKADKELIEKLNIMFDNELISKAEIQQISARITLLPSLEETAKEATYIIEAIPEKIEMKQSLYKQLEQLTDENVIIASNTSGFMPTALAKETSHPKRFIVTHFWNPAHLIPLVEIVKGEKTNEETADRTMRLMKVMGKKAILLEKEVPGFIGNRLQYALFREAQALLDEKIVTKEDIDAAITYSIGRRLPITGPLMTADLGGLDVFSSISDYLFKDLSTANQSGATLTNLVAEEKLGYKNGEGFYLWDQEISEQINAEREKTLIHFLKRDQENGLFKGE
ncbi:3-hydroxyacyl-CoA dehydrogenase family protein [Oceanobacillus timonensis]|uniref:3-hydroxyacyl-CoA dehydrogenase family protein n=1 Tax=Oceanobacillus timonensis TaxID=1926285 RepID=UPI0009BAEA26|nr:3-hydroxyacyl-CoA dehydrogenase NAD-binding domain-containing protein [Oceanobacillus timonensis]